MQKDRPLPAQDVPQGDLFRACVDDAKDRQALIALNAINVAMSPYHRNALSAESVAWQWTLSQLG